MPDKGKMLQLGWTDDQLSELAHWLRKGGAAFENQSDGEAVCDWVQQALHVHLHMLGLTLQKDLSHLRLGWVDARSN